jgi:hypothetical protein
LVSTFLLYSLPIAFKSYSYSLGVDSNKTAIFSPASRNIVKVMNSEQAPRLKRRAEQIHCTAGVGGERDYDTEPCMFSHVLYMPNLILFRVELQLLGDAQERGGKGCESSAETWKWLPFPH